MKDYYRASVIRDDWPTADHCCDSRHRTQRAATRCAEKAERRDGKSRDVFQYYDDGNFCSRVLRRG